MNSSGSSTASPPPPASWDRISRGWYWPGRSNSCRPVTDPAWPGRTNGEIGDDRNRAHPLAGRQDRDLPAHREDGRDHAAEDPAPQLQGLGDPAGAQSVSDTGPAQTRGDARPLRRDPRGRPSPSTAYRGTHDLRPSPV